MNKTFRKTCAKLHLWLGLLSGIVVFIVCITGSLYAFKDEINEAMQPWRFVSVQEKKMLPPSEVLAVSDSVVGGSTPTAITYGEAFDAVFVDYYVPGVGMSTVFINPYNGQVLKTVRKAADDFDFFRFVLDGHRTLWLPRNIGSPIVGYSVLLFLVTLITGLVLWWPRRWTAKAIIQRLTLKRPFTPGRLNFDLHNVVGLYMLIPLIVLCFTGLIFSLSWFSKAVYVVTSGGRELKPYILPLSDTLQVAHRLSDPLDQLYNKLKAEEPAAKTFYFALPTSAEGVIRVSIVHRRGSYYRTDNLFFDRYTLKTLKGSGPYAGKYTEVSPADKFRRMNLDLHDGRIFGIFGKVLMFFAGIIGASLPITGFIIQRKKYRKSKHN